MFLILLQLFSGFFFKPYMKSIYQKVSLQWQKAAVSLFCQNSTEAKTGRCVSNTAAVL